MNSKPACRQAFLVSPIGSRVLPHKEKGAHLAQSPSKLGIAALPDILAVSRLARVDGPNHETVSGELLHERRPFRRLHLISSVISPKVSLVQLRRFGFEN
jgi:hypothetical protein